MRALILTCALSVLAFGAHAAGEADESQSKAIPSQKVTKEEKAKARTQRHNDTAAASKSGQMSKGEADASQAKAMASVKATPEEKAKARDDRHKATAEAIKTGQVSKGEK
jgi:hypothetical protein